MYSSASRFSNRVDHYLKYRPGYPLEFLGFLQNDLGLGPGVRVADVGSGTGMLTGPLLHTGCMVYAVEPNREMRTAAESLLGHSPGFVSVDGLAEATGLEPGSVDVITAAQAFHWFDPSSAATEFRRIGRPGAWTVLVWNERQISTPFLLAYEQLIKTFATDYAVVNHKRVSPEKIAGFFAPAAVRERCFANQQHFDLEGLQGRLLSSSYMPADKSEARYTEMMEALGRLFDACQRDGQVTVEYSTRAFYGQLG